MDLSGLFILANDVKFIAVDSITEKTKAGFEHDADDVLITQMSARTTSKVINKDLATILQEFRSPKSLADVIYLFSESQQKDPQQVADEVFGSLVSMQEWGFIVPYDLAHPSKKASLQLKESFREYKIIERLRFLNDTEVYRVKDNAGNILALKLLKNGNSMYTQTLFNNEMAILQLLDNVVNPKLLDHGSEDGNKFLVTAWCEGVTSINEAMRYRNINSRDNFIRQLNLSISILKAYEHLHRQKVLHGDVNPDNILISSSGSVKIIDYGYAVFDGNGRKVGRGGTGWYYEPEFADATIQGMPAAALTEKGEQYSIAVLLYYLISGQHYLDFSLEKDKLYEQIARDEPLSFKNFDLQVPDELDKVMKTALQKDPEKRFASLEDFARALTRIRNDVSESNRFYVFNKKNTGEGFITFLLQKFGWESSFIERGLSLSPTCSVNYGSAGIAYMFYRISCLRGSATLSDLADTWINRALLYKHDHDAAFYSKALGINEKIAGKTALYHSPSGLYVTQALISNSRNDFDSLSSAVNSFLSVASIPCDKIDLTLGKSGLLIGCSILYKELLTIKDYPLTSIVALAEKIKNEIWEQLDQYPSLCVTNPVDYFGIAHGWAGLLYGTLLWCDTASRDLPPLFMKRLDELLACAIREEDHIRWPITVADKHSWQGWCNGSAGHIFLWVLLYKRFKDDKYIRVAEKISDYIMTGPQTNNADLCCGMSGIAYAMMSLYGATNDNKYLYYIQRLKQNILENWPVHQMRNNSLYKGEVGAGVLISEMEMPALARMPLFEL